MNFLNLEYFVVLSEEMNFSKAANRLYISQQSLSTHIRKLERECGLPLFDRGVPLRLTEAGRHFLISARSILEEKADMEKQMADLRDFRQGDVTIGIPSSRGVILLPRLITTFQQNFPQVKTHLVEGNTAAVTEALYSGKTDLTIGFECPDEDRIISDRLYLETTKIIVPYSILEQYFGSREPFPTDKPLPLSTFSQCPFVSIQIDTWLGKVLYGACEEAGFKPKIIMETSNTFTMLSLCCSGAGVCICPNSFLSIPSPLISSRLLDQTAVYSLLYEEGRHWITVSHLKDKYLTRASRAFIQMAKQLYGSD